MKTLAGMLAVLALGVGIAAAQPTIDAGSVTNAASYISPALPNGGLAQGSMFVVKGKNLGACGLNMPGTLPLATALGGTSIKITAGGTSVDAPMIYVLAGRGKDASGQDLPDQLAAIIPSNTPTTSDKSAEVKVTYSGQTSAAEKVQIVKTAFGMFTVNQAGSGPAIVQNYVSASSTPTNLLTEAAYPGQAGILWGTGLGPINASDAGAPPVSNLDVTVEVIVGGKQADVFYKGRSPQFPGIDQINFYIPQDVAGCYVPIVVKAGGVVSNFGSIAVAQEGKICSDPNGFTADELAKLSSGSLKFGVVSLSRLGLKLDAGPLGVFDTNTDSGSGSFLNYQAAQLVGAQRPFGSNMVGTCMVFSYTGTSPLPVDPVQPVGLDAGSKLTVNGPKGQKDLPGTSGVKGDYGANLGGGSSPFGNPPLYLDPGNYTIAGTGGTDIGAFSVAMTLPQMMTWSNRDTITTIPRTSGLNVTWTGGAADSWVGILGASATQDQIGAAFLCTANASAGQFTVPTEVLSALPPSVSLEGIPTGYLGITNSGKPMRFTASGCDVCTADYSSTSAKTVTYQ